MTKKIIPSIIGKNNEYLNKYPVLGSGGFSVVYDINDLDNIVLKHSFIPNDGFRYLSDLSLTKRVKMGLIPIIERKICGDDIYYLLPKLKNIHFSENELECLKQINEKQKVDCNTLISEKIYNILTKVNNLISILKDEQYELDISEDNIMEDIDGNIYLTDPIAEFFD